MEKAFSLQGLTLAVASALLLVACGADSETTASTGTNTMSAAQKTPTPQVALQGATSSTTFRNVTFDEQALGAYVSANFQADWGVKPTTSSGLSAGRLNIVQDPKDSANKVLQVTYMANQIGGSSAMVFDSPIPPPSSGVRTNMWFQFRVMFPSDFTWVKGGKLPGLGGGDTPTGCIDNGTFDGFTTRLMWRENGVANSYLYFPTKLERCGDYYPLNFTFKAGQWYTLKQQVKLNDVGQSNGFLVQYIDGVQYLNLKNMEWRKADTVGITAIKMDTFFGGSTTDWAPATNQYVYFDDFIVTNTSADLP